MTTSTATSAPASTAPATKPIATLRAAIAKQITSAPRLPAGHTGARAFAYVFGREMKSTPAGHPIQIGTPIFDNTVVSAVYAIAKAAQKWHGIVPYAAHWRLDFVEDVIQPSGRPAIPYSKVYHFTYLPEQATWKFKGLDTTKVINHFKESHWLTKNWQRAGNAVNQALATALIPSTVSTSVAAPVSSTTTVVTPISGSIPVPVPTSPASSNTSTKAASSQVSSASSVKAAIVSSTKSSVSSTPSLNETKTPAAATGDK